MIEGVVFDLDHTLFDRYATIRATLPVMYEQLSMYINSRLSCEQFCQAVVDADRSYIHRGWDYVWDKLIEQGVITRTADKAELNRCLFYDCWPRAAVPFEFTDRLLKWLRESGYLVGLITNGEHSVQQAKLDLLGIERYFDRIVICGDVGKNKPNRLPFDIMSESLGITADRLCYVGDNPLNDVQGARAAGYLPIWVRTTGSWIFDDIERAEHEIDTVADLPSLLKKL